MGGHDMRSVGDINLWAIGYDEPTRATEVRDELLRVENIHGLRVLDSIVFTRTQDGSYSLDRKETPSVASGIVGYGVLGGLIGLVVLQPLAGAAIAATVG